MKTKAFLLTIVAACILGFTYKEDIHQMGLRFTAPAVTDRTKVYDPEIGEIVYDSSVPGFFGRDNTGWVPMSSGQSILPPGIIMPFAGTTAPVGFLVADGSAVSRTTYAALFSTIGTSFGVGNGVDTFNLPDLRGRFMRGVDGSAGRDPDKATRSATNGGNSGNNVGSVQDDEFKSHTHSVGNNTIYAGSANNSSGGDYPNTSFETGARGGNETRPKNINVNFIIKY